MQGQYFIRRSQLPSTFAAEYLTLENHVMNFRIEVAFDGHSLVYRCNLSRRGQLFSPSIQGCMDEVARQEHLEGLTPVQEEVDHRGDQRGSGCGRVAETYIPPPIGQPQEAEAFSFLGLASAIQAIEAALPLRKDGQADMAALNAEHSVQPLKKDGAPELRYKWTHVQVHHAHLSLNSSKTVDSVDQGLDTRHGGLSLAEARRFDNEKYQDSVEARTRQLEQGGDSDVLPAIVQEVFETQQLLPYADLASLRHRGCTLLTTTMNADTPPLNHVDEFGRSTLMQAVLLKCDDICHGLLEKGVDVNIQDKDGWTALMYAVILRRRLTTVALIAYGVDLDLRNKLHDSASDLASKDVDFHLVFKWVRKTWKHLILKI
jgi:hypothetical protein